MSNASTTRKQSNREFILGISNIYRPDLNMAAEGSHVMGDNKHRAIKPDHRYTNAVPSSPEGKLAFRGELSKSIIKWRLKGGRKQVCPVAGNPYIAFNVPRH